MENQYQWQYIIVTVLVVCFIIWQISSYRKNDMRINRIRHLFPNTDKDYQVIQCNKITTIYCENADGDFKRTLDDINKYLSKNENKTFDYQIIKEIVERNSQSLEDEVDTMLSAPLYLGLMATIIGIAFGVVSFAWNDLASMLTGANMNTHGIEVLLTDVGIAMVASFVGVLCTKLSTQDFNDARTDMNQSKNVFLTWVQSDLMSKLSDDITGAILKMTADLNEFNRTFAKNTKELKETLSTVNDNYKGQVKLLDAIEKLKITKIAKANIEVYDRLQGCTDELEKLFEVLSDSESYIAKVTELNNNIGSIEERTRIFEELGTYFKNEIEYVKDRQGYMRQQMSGLDAVLQDALSNLGDNLTHSLQQLTTVFQSQNQRIQELIESQQNELTSSLVQQQREVNEKIGKIENPFSGLKETFENGIGDLKGAFETQNKAIKDMLNNQKELLEQSIKSQQDTLLQSVKSQQDAVLQKLQETPIQLQSLTEITKAIKELNSKIDKLKPAPIGTTTIVPTPEITPYKPSKVEKFFSIILSIGTIGIFLTLLATLLFFFICINKNS